MSAIRASHADAPLQAGPLGINGRLPNTEVPISCGGKDCQPNATDIAIADQWYGPNTTTHFDLVLQISILPTTTPSAKPTARKMPISNAMALLVHPELDCGNGCNLHVSDCSRRRSYYGQLACAQSWSMRADHCCSPLSLPTVGRGGVASYELLAEDSSGTERKHCKIFV